MTQKRVEAFLAIADEEIEAAERLCDPLPRQAQYFLQQGVEKLIRAVLEHGGHLAGTGHNLAFLAGLLPPAHALRDRFKAFEHLSAASTRYRYPSPTGKVHSVSEGDAAKTLADVKRLRADVTTFLREATE